MQCRDTERALQGYNSQLPGKRNAMFERFKFFSRVQFSGETIDDYVRDLIDISEYCEFGKLRNSLVRDKIISGMLNCKVRERLLRESDLSLDDTIIICRTAEIMLNMYEARANQENPRRLHEKASEHSSYLREYKDLDQKMTVKKSFPWRTGCIVLITAIGALLVYDVKKHGTFNNSSTGRFLRDIGALSYGEQAWINVKAFSSRSYEWAQSNLPQYYVAASEKAQPFFQLCWDKGVIAADYLLFWYSNMKVYVEESTPVIIKWVNYYAPGLLDKLSEYSLLGYEAVMYYFAVLLDYFLEYMFLSIEWIKNNVFTGSLSPENIQRYSMEAFNTTQVYALWTYDWVCQKVQTLSKIH